jgi:hypothetical protein
MGNTTSTSSPPPTLYTDVSGIFQVQQSYYSPILSGVNDPSMNSNINSVQSQLDNLNNGFQQANVSTTQVLTHQKDMINIVDTEKKRLLAKKQNIDHALEEKKRAIELNDSYRQRYEIYIKMVIIITFGLAILFGIQLLGNYFPVIPSFVISLFAAIDILIVLFMCYFLYLDIQRRDPLHFNELNLSGPVISTSNQVKTSTEKAKVSGDLLGSINLGQCVGVACCSDGTVWDASNSYCVPGTLDASGNVVTSSPVSTLKSGFTTISLASKIGDLNRGFVQPSSPNEFEHYSKIV